MSSTTMKSKIETKICGVCGDKALGHNFNALSCESCKAFFRRNALTQKNFKCPFNNQCEITTITRRFCQKCRLDKCIAIGMCKDLIMSEEDKVAKRQKIQENRVKRECNSGFKKGFKKIKRETGDLNTQDSDYIDITYNDIDAEDTLYNEETNKQNKSSQISVVNKMDLTIYSNKHKDETISSTERLVSSSDDISVTDKALSSGYHSNRESSSESDTASTLNEFVTNGIKYDSSDPNSITSKNSVYSCTEDVVGVVQR